jgi:carbohydrate ABC transporter membrane protein 1, CUT1 family (TC 3.A.1.1.-)
MQLVTDGGPIDSTMTIMLYLYQKGITGYEMGYACAIGVITLLIILIMTGVQLKLTGKGAVDYE